MRVLIVGHGRMGTLVESLASAYGAEVAGVIDEHSVEAVLGGPTPIAADVAIDFTLPDAVPKNLPRLAMRGINVVIGTTGWKAHESDMRAVVEQMGIGVLVGANFSLGMNLFQLVVAEAARRFAAQPDFGAWIHEVHHDQKKDAPSGTALTIKDVMMRAGYARGIDVSSSRAGFVPGTHTVGFDGPSETIELTHTVRDRAVFARGALVAARWLVGKRGWYSIADMF
jgi:4-hydroxy-tetrahydrodipicolinate reductase